MDKVFAGTVRQELQKRIEELQEEICLGSVNEFTQYTNLRGRMEGLIIARDLMDDIIRSFDTSQTD